MVKNQNSPHDWDYLLGNQDYLDDYEIGTKYRINTAKKWISGHKKVINIGSGQGYLESDFSDDIQNGKINWTSLDISLVGLKQIKNKYSKVNIIEGSILDLSNIKMHYEIVVCMEVIEHIFKKKVKKLFQELTNIGTNDALYIISVPVYEPVSLINHPVGHNRKFTPKIIIKELCENGFEILDAKLLFAFKSNYLIKSIVSNKLKLRRPSVAMFLCQKS
jgi:SAM-dependent methyltransferase